METIRTRVCIISDTHTQPPFASSNTTKAYRHPLPAADILLHAGDITRTGRLSEHKAIVDVLKHQSTAEIKLVIAGNHDITLDTEYYYDHARRTTASSLQHQGESHGEENTEAIKNLYTDADARAAGIVYLEEEVKTFSLRNGARFTVYASPYTPEFCGWAFAYDREEDRFNPVSNHPHPESSAAIPVPSFPAVDIMLTHGPPFGFLDQVLSGERVGCENLLRACARARPRLHVFGHIHEAFGAVRHNWVTETSEPVKAQDPKTVLEQRSYYSNLSRDPGGGPEDGHRHPSRRPLLFGEETLFVNASIMNVRYQAENAPWVVDLDLPAAS